jgi:bifunctional DNA-binding transcriptional regulator/antitoxin component of YhaV-PrlF toxin-antitoxin module
VDDITLKVDSKGRICLPAEIRKELGNVVILKKTSKGYLLIPDKQAKFQEEFRALIHRKHRRTGKPAFSSPSEMKKIWEPKV